MKKLRKREIEKYKKAKFDKSQYISNYHLDREGNAVVRIKLPDFDGAFSPFSPAGYEVASADLTDYIDGVVYNIPLAHPIILQVNCRADGEQQQLLRRVLHDFYGLRAADKQHDLRINSVKGWGLFIVGAAMLIFSYTLVSAGFGQFFTDFMNIAGTFALWEAVNTALLERKVIKVELLNAGQTLSAQIIFEEERAQ